MIKSLPIILAAVAALSCFVSSKEINYIQVCHDELATKLNKNNDPLPAEIEQLLKNVKAKVNKCPLDVVKSDIFGSFEKPSICEDYLEDLENTITEYSSCERVFSENFFTDIHSLVDHESKMEQYLGAGAVCFALTDREAIEM